MRPAGTAAGAVFERTLLPDGPRVISARLPGTRSLSVAAYVLAGSRQEDRGCAGVAHFMEHLTFRGTASFPSTRAVSETIEGVGGSTNAATDRESTVYYARLPVREAEIGVRMLSELVVRPLLRDEDIARERDVIVEEIRSYRDDPGQYIYNVFDEAFYGDTPLGWEIAGDECSVEGLTGPIIRDFWGSSYRPANLVVAVAGDLEHRTAVDLVAAAFGRGNGVVPGFAPAPALPNGARFKLEERESSQAYLCLGVPALRRDDPEAWTLELLNAVLGEGASSRLFLRVREDEGLAYDIHSFPTDHADCGSLQVFAGVDPEDLPKALSSILEELARLRDEPIPDDELRRTRRYLQGRLELRLEESRNLCSWFGVQEALHDRVLTLDDALAALDAVTADRVQGLAGRLLHDDLLALAVIAPRRTARGLEKKLRLP